MTTDTLADGDVFGQQMARASFFPHREESLPELRQRVVKAVDLRRATQAERTPRFPLALRRPAPGPI